MYYFPVLEVRSLKWVSLVQIKVSVKLCSFPDTLAESVSLFFLASRGSLHSLAHFSVFEIRNIELSPFHSATSLVLPLTLLLPSCTYKDAYDYLEPIWIIQDYLFISISVD